jgi:hypothetical protein
MAEPDVKKVKVIEENPRVPVTFFFNRDAESALPWDIIMLPTQPIYITCDFSPAPEQDWRKTSQYLFRAERALSHLEHVPPANSIVPYEPLKFHFTRDPNIPLPLVARYTVLKKMGQIQEHVSYEEWARAYCADPRNRGEWFDVS